MLTAVDHHDLLLDAIGRLTPLSPTQQAIPRSQPNLLRDTLAAFLPGRDVVLTGTLERRLLAVSTGQDGTWLLADLYRREHFPLPLFPLAISDLARAARSTLCGRVDLMDMQLGATMPDIVGVSATFGQHNLLTRLLEAVQEQVPLVLAGGSLTARNRPEATR